MRNSSKNVTARPILLMGWDAADWHLIDEIRAKGLMPNLDFLMTQGSTAHLASLVPTLSPLLWTSVVTGKRAHEHGVLSFVEEAGDLILPISSTSRRKPAIWNILSSANLRTLVVNWWPSHPVEAIHGEMIAQPFFRNPDKAKDSVYPPSKFQTYRDLSQMEGDVSQLKAFFPEHGAEELESDPLVGKVHEILRRSSRQANVALEACVPGSFDLALVYFEALDQIKHLAIKYHPPKLEEIPDDEYRKYRHIVSAAYQWMDLVLGAFLKRLGNEVNYLIVSDHGFAVNAARQIELGDLPAAPATEHRPFGVLLGAGPDIKVQSKLFGAGLLDLFPNLLYHFNLPVGDDLEGRIWTNFWKKGQKPSRIPSWDPVITDFPFIANAAAPPKDLIQDLVALGYWDDQISEQIAFVREEQAYNKAVSLGEAHQYLEALAICEAQREKSQKVFRWYVLEGNLRLKSFSGEAWLQWYASLEKQWQEIMPLAFSAALAYLQKGDYARALTRMQALEEKGLKSPVLFGEMGQALFLAGRLAQARTYFEKALDLDPQSARALNGLAQVAFADGDYPGFEKWANQALELKFFQPQLHYLWALHYYRLKMQKEAQQALHVCLQLAPKHVKALSLLEKMEHRSTSKPQIIVTGFPRSGTSLMMAILQAAGLELLVDKKRVADVHNPKGYYEWEPVKDLARGIDWPSDESRVVKVVAPLLPYLPAQKAYKLIWMERPTVEILLSQAKMKGEAADLENFPFEKGQQLESEKRRIENYLDQQTHFHWQRISLKDCFDNPMKVASDLSAFLGLTITAEIIEKVVDPKLRRQRIG